MIKSSLIHSLKQKEVSSIKLFKLNYISKFLWGGEGAEGVGRVEGVIADRFTKIWKKQS